MDVIQYQRRIWGVRIYRHNVAQVCFKQLLHAFSVNTIVHYADKLYFCAVNLPQRTT